MAGRLIIEVAQPALDSNGNLINGSTLEFYDAATLAPKNVFSSSALTTSLGNVVTASGGFFPEIWAADGEAYRVVWKNAAGSVLRTMDNMTAQDNADVALLPIANITALRAATWPSGRPSTVQLVSNWATGDGGGVFRWDATSTATDNSGTIIKETATATGRWLRQFDGVHRPEFYGDTTTSAGFTAAMQAAITGAGTGARISVPTGGTLTAQLTLLTGQVLEGRSGRSEIFKGFNGDMIDMSAAQCGLENLFLRGQGATFTGRGVVIGGGSYQYMENVWTYDTPGFSLEFTASNAGAQFRGERCTYQRTVVTDPAIGLVMVRTCS